LKLMKQGALGLIFRRLAQGLIALALLGAAATSVMARPRTASMVVDVHTGRVLHKHKSHLAVYPASLTKLMTLYLVFEALEKKQIDWTTPIAISHHAASRSPSKLGLKPGDTITVRDAVGALIVKSANDIAAAVAEHLAGSEPAFAHRMTARAHQLGMTDTQFRNASGLPDAHQRTTAHDMIQLALHLVDDYPQYFNLFATRRFVYRGRVYRNHNRLLGRFPGTDGLKTGYTRASGFNLVASVHRNHRHVIGVVFGGRSARRRNQRMRYLLTKALRKASPVRSKLRRSPRRVRAQRRPHANAPAQTSSRRPALASTIELRRYRLAARARRNQTPPQTDPNGLHVARVQTRPIEAHRPPPTSSNNRPAGAAVRQPSTLNAQARALARPHEPAETLRAPQPALRWTGQSRRSALGAAPPADRYHIQVGAYSSAVEAQARLKQLFQRFGGFLANAQPAAAPTIVGDRRIFRARFVGLDAAAATAACTEMRRRTVDCFVGQGN
jgi:D-alanyl-D-alanine carboxypeptidase